MIGDVKELLLDIKKDDQWLEAELAAPILTRITECAIARESRDPLLRRVAWIAERLHLNIPDLPLEGVAPPPIH